MILSTQHSERQIEERMWKEIAKARYGMLGLIGKTPVEHFQPMTAFCEPETGTLWFFTKTTTDLAKAVDADVGEAMFTVQSKDHELQACVGGHISLSDDGARMDKFWNPVVAAWFPEGRNDPQLTLLRLDGRDASVWLSETGPIRFAYEIAKANMIHKTPEIGQQVKLNLS
jgi:general stress protein 26